MLCVEIVVIVFEDVLFELCVVLVGIGIEMVVGM